MIDLRLGDCLDILKTIPDKSVDLIVTDPPYELNLLGGGSSKLTKRAKSVAKELYTKDLDKGFEAAVLSECMRVCKKANMYIWCSRLQVHKILDFAVENNLVYDILIWVKDNPIPTYNLHYLSDKEYCILLKEKSALCQPVSYEFAKTVIYAPINKKDKDLYKHPTIKPLQIIERLVVNSTLGGGGHGTGPVYGQRNYGRCLC